MIVIQKVSEKLSSNNIDDPTKLSSDIFSALLIKLINLSSKNKENWELNVLIISMLKIATRNEIIKNISK